MTELLAARIFLAGAVRPDAVAVRGAGEEVVFREFLHRVRSFSNAVSGMRRVAVLPTSDVESLVAVVGAMHAGVSVVLLHRHLPPAHLAHALALAQPGALVAATSQHRRLRRMGFDGEIHTAASLPEQTSPPGSPVTPETELLVGLTSGTTGTPKLFVRDQRSWSTTLDRSDSTFPIAPGDTVATPGALDHTHFLYGALHALTRGATADLRPALTALEAGATHLYTVPAIAVDIVRSGSGPFPAVRRVLSSAARWSRTARAALRSVLPNAEITHFYGASELSFVAADHGLGAPDDTAAGELFDGVDAEIRDGLVHIRSDMLFTGYLTEHGITGGPDNGWCTVGDRGALHGRHLHLHGRASEMLIRGGLNVEPAEVESALTALPGVLAAACVALPDPRMGEVPAAAIVVTAAAPAAAELRARLRETLPAPAVPVRILRLPALPRTPRGKVDRAAVRVLLAAALE
ncbi:AMP-binding protein [Nocardia asteroides]|uniref:AMP-binding protein n=1 Tax=Nocardia asteroides TaxID=1824 RepID=UPI001E534D0E|nr:AMP-binding protein [Nocardia asteroides]UGT61375.1 AMP-binding protein [Nocardia asteroides]